MEVKPAKRLIRETKAMIRLRLFLRHDCGLRERLSAKDLRLLLDALKQPKKGLI